MIATGGGQLQSTGVALGCGERVAHGLRLLSIGILGWALLGLAPQAGTPTFTGIWSVTGGGYVWMWADGRAETRDSECGLTSRSQWSFDQYSRILKFVNEDDEIFELTVVDAPDPPGMGDIMNLVPLSGNSATAAWMFLGADPEEACE